MRQDGASTDRTVKRPFWTPARILAICLVILALGGAAYLYPFLSRWAGTDRSIDIRRVNIGEVTRGDLLRDVSVEGKIIAADRPTLVSPAQGVASLLVKAGDILGKGDALARIESPELQNRLKQEQSTLLSMQAEIERQRIAGRQDDQQNRQQAALLELKLAAGKRAMERAQRLFEEGLGSSVDFEKARDDVEVISLELSHARNKVDLAKGVMDFELQTKELELRRQELKVADLQRQVKELLVVSPVSGLVARVEVKDKDTVQANQALFSVVNLSEFEVEILIPENYAPEIAPETPAVILYEGREHTGRVKSISPEVESSQVKGVVVFDGKGPVGLKQNQRVSTRLILDSRRGVVKVPRGPFLESMGGRQVYVVEDGVAHLRPCRTGAVSVTEVEILEGLQAGDRIILSDLAEYGGARRILLRN
jgi:HlyD family secretion protein